MPEKINELNIQNTKETIPGDKEQSREGPEMVEGEELNKVATDISEIKNKIDHDQPITEKNILELKENINNLTIDIGGEKVSIKEIRNREDLKRNLEIFKEIKTGNFKNHEELTFITSKVAESLSKHEGNLYLDDLTSLSTKAAESLNGHNYLLSLNGLTSLSDNVAESLIKHEGGSLYLNGLTALSDNVAENLSKYEGYLHFDGLTALSDNVAESLSKHKGYLSLNGLISLSENVAKSLSKHKNISVPDNIQQQINKFK